MKRRFFVKSSIITAVAGVAGTSATMAAKPNAAIQEFYELRTYILKNDAQQKLVEAYFATAAIPALNRLGSKNIGVFTELKPEGQTRVYALIPYSSMDDYLTVQGQLANDPSYQQKATAYLNAPSTDPAYERIESSLLKAFVHSPKIQVPGNNPRMFELRRYEHATEGAGKKKLEMFNDAGEVDIFKRLNFNPVFFGETIIGDHRPNLIYMVTFDDMAAHDSHWKAFVDDAQWKKISVIPDYADAKLVNHITSTFLVPAACSQI